MEDQFIPEGAVAADPALGEGGVPENAVAVDGAVAMGAPGAVAMDDNNPMVLRPRALGAGYGEDIPLDALAAADNPLATSNPLAIDPGSPFAGSRTGPAISAEQPYKQGAQAAVPQVGVPAPAVRPAEPRVQPQPAARDYGFAPGGRWAAFLDGFPTNQPAYFEVGMPPALEVPNRVFLRAHHWDAATRSYASPAGLIALDAIKYLQLFDATVRQDPYTTNNGGYAFNRRL